jgi:CHAT domain-containing protein
VGYALVALVCMFSVALAGPAEDLAKVEQEYYKAVGQQASSTALKLAKQLYDLQVKVTGASSREARNRKQTLAGAYQSAGDFANAEKLYTELLHAAEKEHGADSRDAQTALTQLSGVYLQQQRYDDVEPIVQRILAIIKKLDGENSREYAAELNTYGSLLQWRSEFSAAIRTYEDVLRHYEKIAPAKDDSSLLSPLQTLAAAYWYGNQQPKAIATYDRAIHIAETGKDVMFILRMSTIWSAAMVYQFGNRKDLAAPLFAKAIALTEKEVARLEKDKPDDWSLQSLIGQLGFMYRYSGNLAKAEAAYQKAIALAKKKNLSSGYEMMLADLRRIQGRNKDALELLEKSKAEMAKYGGDASIAYNSTIADVLKEMGDYKRAEKLLLEYRAYLEKLYTKKNPTIGYAVLSLANLHAVAGDIKAAENEYKFAFDLAEKDLQNAMRQGTQADHAVYFARYSYVLDTALNFHMNIAPTSGTAGRLALTTLLRRKGRVLDAAAASLATLRTKLSKDDQKLLDALAAARTQLAQLMISGSKATGGDQAAFTKEVAALEDKIQALEGKVSKKSAAYRTVTQPINLDTIQKLIPKDARLVEFVNYQPYDIKQTYAQLMSFTYKPRHYLAYVVGHTGDPIVVPLGEAAPIEAAVEKFRKALADPDNDGVNDLGKALDELTFAKIAPELGGATNILIAPDGALNVVPFSALVDDKGDYLIKKFTFTYLTSGRDLMRLAVKTKSQGGGVLFADPSFDSTKDPADKDESRGHTSRGMRSADLASLQWPRLPGTAAEADAVTKMFKGLKVYRGDAATEGTVKHLKGPKILHLATHGFFLPDETPPPSAGDGRGSTPQPAAVGMPVVSFNAAENPLLRSGLAFAGANKLQSGDDDGLLTALEASALDLQGTKLVVLSACETGVGKVTNGDGVYGLRRSLVIAGAESLVMSMWQVDDFATKELMSGFYKRLAHHEPRSAALRETQLELLAKKAYSHPFYWAAFLPAGATTPLEN